MDQDLNDDMNKLVRFSIICVDRENETVLQSARDTIVKDRMDSGGFIAWKISEFLARLTRDGIEIPEEWRCRTDICNDIENGRLRGLPEEARKHLRVAYHVIDRYPRERFKYEEQQIQVLRDIQSAINEKRLPLPKPGEQIQIEHK